MGQKAGEKWTAAAKLQPTFPKSDRLLDTACRVGETVVIDGQALVMTASSAKRTAAATAATAATASTISNAVAAPTTAAAAAAASASATATAAEVAT